MHHSPVRYFSAALFWLTLSTCASTSFLSAQAGSGRGAAPSPAPTADTHKAWMDDIADLQEDIRDGLAAKDATTISTAALKIQQLMAQTEKYWATRKADDVVKLAQDEQALCGQVSAAAKASKIDDTQAAFEKLSATCNSCHDLHPEKRP